MKKPIVIGLTENIVVQGKKLKGRIDTGATRSSIDINLAKELKLGPVIRQKKVKSAHGTTVRGIVEAQISIAKKKLKAEFTLAERTHMKYKVLVGQNILKMERFMIDPSID